jgi:hypothetical protein
MPKTERDPLGPSFQWRLRSALDRIEPGHATARYAEPSTRALSPLRFTRLALASGVAGILALTAFAATGSANPAVWTQRIVGTIRPSPIAEPSPTPAESPTPSTNGVVPAVPAHTPTGEASPRPESPETPEATPQSASPSPTSGDGGHSGSGGDPSPSPER